MQEIGHAALAIIPSFDGFQGQLERGSSKAMLAAGDTGGAKFGDAAGKSAGARFSGHIKNAAKIAAVGLAAASAAAFKFAGDSLEEAREAQKIGAQTAAVIKSTGGAAKVTEKDVGRLTGRLSDMAGVDDELIQNGANVLLTFTKIRNETGKGSNIFDRATKAALNMSTALGSDLKGASVQVGKALNDPVKGATALSRAGVQFTTIQKAQIKALVEGGAANAAVATGLVADTKAFNDLVKAQDGDVAKVVDTLTNKLTPAQKKTFDMYREGGHQLDAQKRILKELDTQFAGSAKSQATDADKLKVAYGNLKEEVGTALIPVMDDLATFLRKKGIPAARDFFGWVKDDGIPAMKNFYDQTEPVRKVVGDLVDVFSDLPTGGKLASIAGVLAGGLVVKHKLAGIFDRGGLANPMFVTVTNPGFGGGGAAAAAGKGGALLSNVKTLALPLTAAVTIAGASTVAITKISEVLAPKATEKGIVGTPGGGYGSPLVDGIDLDRTAADKAKEKGKEIVELTTKADAFRESLFLAGSTKVKPELAVPGLADAKRGVREFIALQIEAGRPVYSSIFLTGIERAFAQLDTLDARLHGLGERGVDNGVTYQHGGASGGSGGGAGNGRVQVNIGSVQAHDYGDFMSQMQRRTQQAGIGGF